MKKILNKYLKRKKDIKIEEESPESLRSSDKRLWVERK